MGHKKKLQWELPHLLAVTGILVAIFGALPLSSLYAQTPPDGGMPPPPPPVFMPPPPMDQPPPPPPTTPPPVNNSNFQPTACPVDQSPCAAMNGACSSASACALLTTTSTGATPFNSTNLAPCPTGVQPTSTNPCMVSGSTSNTQMSTLPPCAAGQIPNPSAPCQLPSSMMTNMSSCDFTNQYWEVATNTCLPRSNCTTPSNPKYNSQECQGVRGMTSPSTAPTFPTSTTCPAGQTPCAAMNNACSTASACSLIKPTTTQTQFPVAPVEPNNQFMAPTAIQPCAAGQVPTQTTPCVPSFNTFQLPTAPMMNGMVDPNGQFNQPQQFTPPQPCAVGQMPTPQAPCIPNFDFSTGVPQFEGFDPSKQFQQFTDEFAFDPNQLQFQVPKAPPASQVAREAKALSKELSRTVKEINRGLAKAANLTTLPGMAEASAFSAEAQSRIAQLDVAVTEANAEDVWTLIQATRDPNEGLFIKMGNIMQGLQMAQELTHFVKQLNFCEKDLTQLASQASGQAKSQVQANLSKVAALKADPFAGQSAEDVDPRDLMFAYDDLCGRGMDDLRFEVYRAGEAQNTCGELENVKGEIQGFLGGKNTSSIPKAFQAKAKSVAPKALAIIEEALNESTAEACIGAMQNLEGIQRQIFAGNDQASFFQVDSEDLLRNQISEALGNGEDVDALIDRISSKIIDNVKLAANKIFADLTATLGQNGITLDASSQDALNNITALPKEVLDKTLQNRNDISDVVAQAAPLIPTSVEKDFDALAAKALKYNYSESATEEVKQELDAFANLMASAPTASEVKTEIKELTTKLDQIQKQDVRDQVKEGLVPFENVNDPSAYYFGPMAALKDDGVLTKGNPTDTLNNSELAVMFVRATGLADKFDANTQAVATRNTPEWGREAFGVLAAAGVDLAKDDSVNAVAPATRGDFFTTQVQALEAAGVDLPTVQCVRGQVFKDNSCNAESIAALQLHELGIVNGSTLPDGSVVARFDDQMNRAEAAALVNRTTEAPEVQAVLAQ